MEDVKQRYRVTIRCLECGEKFILRGKKGENGKFETGFKRCVCGNEENLEVNAIPE